MRHRILNTIIAAAATLLAGCEKEIDFEYHDIDPILVIEGSLTQNGAAVSLTETSPIDEPMDRRQVAGADVRLVDLSDGSTVSLLRAEDDPESIYRSSAGGIEGHSYRLTVKLPDGRSNTAECRMLPAPATPTLTMAWITMPYDRVAVLQVRFAADPQLCYWVRVYRNGEAYMWSTVAGSAVSGGEINHIFMTSRQDISEEDEDTVLTDGDKLTVTVAPVSRAMHDYIEAIGSDSSGPKMFSGTMALGYFLAAPVSSSELTFHPSEIPDF